MPCANSTGTNKLRLMAIGKAKNPHAFKGCRDNLPVYYSNSQNSWMTAKLFVAWFHEEFVPSVRAFSLAKGLEPKALLLLDNCSPHCAESKELVSDDGLIFAEFLPARTTSLIQPMDQRVLFSLKAKYKKHLTLELLGMDEENIDKKLDRLANF